MRYFYLIGAAFLFSLSACGDRNNARNERFQVNFNNNRAFGCFNNDRHGLIKIDEKILLLKYNLQIDSWNLEYFVRSNTRAISIHKDLRLTSRGDGTYYFRQGRGIGMFWFVNTFGPVENISILSYGDTSEWIFNRVPNELCETHATDNVRP